MEHNVNEYSVFEVPDFNNEVLLKGHSHKYKVVSSGSNMVINVSHLSSILTDKSSYPFSSMIDITVHINTTIIERFILNHYAIADNRLVLVIK